MSAAAALVAAAALAGCGSTTYFAGRTLPPSGLVNRVMIAIQNPSPSGGGQLQIVDAFYDIRFRYNSTNTAPAFTIPGFSGKSPSTIQNMPEEQVGAVYGSGDGTFTLISYAKESTLPAVTGLNGLSSSIFVTRNQVYVFQASQTSNVLTVVDHSSGGSYPLSLPGAYAVSVNPGGSVALVFVQNSNYAYFPRKLTAGESTAYSGGPSTWPKAAVDCEPQILPGWCLFQAQSPDNTDATGNTYGAPLTFDRPIKALFSADGGTAYVLSCGPECGGSAASLTPMPVAPMIYLMDQHSGLMPTQSTLAANTVAIPGGASNALLDGASQTMYVVGQQLKADGYWGGNLTMVNLSATPSVASAPIPVSDGAPGAMSRMILADDNTLWIGMSKCTNGERANNPAKYPGGYGCLTMFNTTTNAATLLPYLGDATGIAAVTGLHKIYTAEGGQVYIYSTATGTALDNQYVTVTGTAYDVAYIDALTDENNTVY
jgi:hypothetical protein